MPTPSLVSEKAALEKACADLRTFTLGRQGVTKKDGLEGIRLVTKRCNRLVKFFGTGPNARQVGMLVASARTRIMAAEARIALLEKNHAWLAKV